MKSRKVRVLTSSLLWIGMLSGCATNRQTRYPASSFTSDQVSTAYQSRANAFLIRGAAIGIVDPSSASPTSLLEGDAISVHSLFEIGSVSKSFTGLTAAILVKEHKLDLDLPIVNYVKEFKDSKFIKTVTVRQLGTHTARLPFGYTNSSGVTSENYDRSQLIRFLKAYSPDPNLYPVGKRSYSDLGFATLGLVISSIEKKPLTEVIREKVLLPLGMSETGFIVDAHYPKELLHGYDVALKPGFFGNYPLSELAAGSGGIYSSLHDMLLFLNANIQPDQSVLGGAIRSNNALSANDAKNPGWGLGWDSNPGDNPVEKDGAMPEGFSSYMTFDLSSKKGTVVLTNVMNGSVAAGLASIALGGQDASLLTGEMAIVPSNVIQSIVGNYQSNDGKSALTVFAIDGNFLGATLTVGDQIANIRLIPYNSTLFSVDDGLDYESALQIQASSNGSVNTVTFFDGSEGTEKPVPTQFQKKLTPN